MFCVKEYNIQNGSFIGRTVFLNNIEAIELAKKIIKINEVNAIVAEVDYDEDGNLREVIIWENK